MNSFLVERFLKNGLGYICLLTLVVLLFYWEGLGAYLDSLDLVMLFQAVEAAPEWYRYLDTWKPLWSGFVHLMYLSSGLDPLPYRLVNLLLYISALPLLYYFYNLFLENRAISKIAMLLFAAFYLHAELVGEFTSNRELLWTLFGLVTLIYFSYYRRTHCLRYYVLALLFGVFTSLSQETSICLPLLLLAVDYHISCGTFPPGLPSLKELRQGLLPHVPFWLMALALLGYHIMAPQGPLFVGTLGGYKPLYDILNQSYFLAIYTFAPCYLTDRLTIILSMVVMGGIGWLFYRSTPQRRSLIVTMTACAGFPLIPYTIVGPTPRYFTFPSVFSMFLVALLAFELGGYIYRLLEERLQGYHLSAERIITTFTVLILLPAIYLNYQEVRQYNKNSVYAGRLVQEIVEGTVRILPQGLRESTIIYLNLPRTVKSKAILSLDKYVAFNNWHTHVLHYYSLQPGIPNSDYYHNTRLAYIDLGYERVRLSPEAWYGIEKYPSFTSILSGKEFDALSMEGRNKILFFNPVTNKLVDVSGWSYEQLEGSIAPYRDELNYDPPIK